MNAHLPINQFKNKLYKIIVPLSLVKFYWQKAYHPNVSTLSKIVALVYFVLLRVNFHYAHP